MGSRCSSGIVAQWLEPLVAKASDPGLIHGDQAVTFQPVSALTSQLVASTIPCEVPHVRHYSNVFVCHMFHSLNTSVWRSSILNAIDIH